MKLEITYITGSTSKGETLISEALAKNIGEITLCIHRMQIIDLLDQAAANSVLTAEDLESVLSRIRRGGRTFHKQSSK
jgi:hypothetical protein